MPFVLDASVTLSWAFPDEQNTLADLVLDRLETEDGAVPALWWFEVRNALIAGERRRRLDPSATEIFLQKLARLPITVDRAPFEMPTRDLVDLSVLTLARGFQLTVYDAAYLELSARLTLPLATLDSDLIKAAGKIGVTLLTG